MPRLPVTILGGYLGAGKTTTVNHVLRYASGRRIAVLVNDFGTLPIDADLIEADEGDLLTLAGGCICCSYGDDLMRALIELSKRKPRPDHVLIETSGVALPGAVARSLSLLFDFSLDAVIVLADAETTAERIDDAYMGDTLTRQFADADLIVVNKCDLVTPNQRDSLIAMLAARFISSRVLQTSRGALPFDVILGVNLTSNRRFAPGRSDASPTTHTSVSVALDGTADLARLAEALRRLDLVRVKGFVQGSNGVWHTIQRAGKRSVVEIAPADTIGPQRLVCIAASPTFNEPALAAALADAGLWIVAP
jgi:G3E family GTPase